jgi:hypothetical protein
MQRMSAQDASFLHTDCDDRPMHVGGVSMAPLALDPSGWAIE